MERHASRDLELYRPWRRDKLIGSVSPRTVILLHGMGRSRASMWPMMWRFVRSGSRALNFPYAPPLMTLDDICRDLVRFIEANVTGPYDLIGHSLGNIIVRHAFRFGYPDGLGRVVMLAPPNHPARLAKHWKDNLLFRVIFGDSGQKLSDEAFYATLPVPPVPFAIVAGDRDHTRAHQVPSDGVVTVESTKLAGAADWAVVHRTHTFMMNAQDTFGLCSRFLELGRFDVGNGVTNTDDPGGT